MRLPIPLSVLAAVASRVFASAAGSLLPQASSPGQPTPRCARHRSLPSGAGHYYLKVSIAQGCENYADLGFVNYVYGISMPETLNLSIFPNPFGEGFYLETNRTVPIEIFDMAGRRLSAQTLTAGHIYIATESWSAGIYILRAEEKIYKLSKNE